MLHDGKPGWAGLQWLRKLQGSWSLELFHLNSADPIVDPGSTYRSVEQTVIFGSLHPSVMLKNRPGERHFNVLTGCQPQPCSAWLHSIGSSASALLWMCHDVDLGVALSKV